MCSLGSQMNRNRQSLHLSARVSSLIGTARLPTHSSKIGVIFVFEAAALWLQCALVSRCKKCVVYLCIEVVTTLVANIKYDAYDEKTPAIKICSDRY